ncbi:MAG: hypothetical protein WC725_04840 [Patescibacteria group bacterium]|jgi:hypothetical protein
MKTFNVIVEFTVEAIDEQEADDKITPALIDFKYDYTDITFYEIEN